MTFATSRDVTARKAYRCACCRGAIPPGTRHLNTVGKWDGQFFAERRHHDCYDLWTALFCDWGDPIEGMTYDMVDVFLDSGDARAAREALGAQRGFFPHAVCRIEFQLRHWLEGGA